MEEPAPAHRTPRGRWHDHIACLAVAAITAVVFLEAVGNDFVLWDDDVNFLKNHNYRGLGPDQLGWRFTMFHGGQYLPLARLTLGLDYTLWGMNPAGYHLTSVLLHAANAAVFYLVAVRVLAAALPADAGAALSRIGAVAATLLFAVHPLRVESVAWVEGWEARALERSVALPMALIALVVLAALSRPCS